YKYGMYINNRISLSQLLERFGFNEETVSVFSEMEKNMIKYVNEPFYYIDNYKKNRRPIKQIIEDERALRDLSEEQTSKIFEKEKLIYSTEEKIQQLENRVSELNDLTEKQNSINLNLVMQKNDLLLKVEELLEDKSKNDKRLDDLISDINNKQEYINLFEKSRIYKIYNFFRVNKIIKMLKGEK
ncbi:hypothetical protein, partial [Anaerosporobacter sp.]